MGRKESNQTNKQNNTAGSVSDLPPVGAKLDSLEPLTCPLYLFRPIPSLLEIYIGLDTTKPFYRFLTKRVSNHCYQSPQLHRLARKLKFHL